MGLKRSISEVQGALEKNIGAQGLVIIEQGMFNNKKTRISGTVISNLFLGRDDVGRWGLVGDWLDTEDIDQSVVGMLELYTRPEWENRKKRKK